jgi:hypothetical protein
MKELIERELEKIRDRIAGMQDYLRLKVCEQDWHGVADAAMDLRDLESEALGLQKAKGLLE